MAGRRSISRRAKILAPALLCLSTMAGALAAPLLAYDVKGDAIPSPLGGFTGDAGRGRAIVLDRARGNCLICHRVPVAGEAFPGDVGPDLAGVGSRLTEGQLRLRLVDQSLIAPETLMPPYYRLQGLRRVGERFRNETVLSGQEIEDVVAWLATLR